MDPVSPPQSPQPVVPKTEWSSGLCSCMEDFTICWYGMFCSGCTTMNVMKIINGQYPTCCDNFIGTALSVLSFYWLGFICHGLSHKHAREQFVEHFNINDTNTCIRSYCCVCCSACQIERELEFRRKNGQLPPPKPYGMT